MSPQRRERIENRARAILISGALQELRQTRHLMQREPMSADQTAPRTIDEYIAGFPPDVQAILEKIRATIREVAPAAEEIISYQIPTFTLNGRYLVYFAAYQKHIGLYPAPRGVEAFREELAAYGGGKGTVRFPLDKPIPFDLIGRIVAFRVKENLGRAEAKGKKK